MLSDKRKAYVQEYLVDLNGTQAAIRAGYSPHSARKTASKLMANKAVRAEIDKALAARSRRTGVTADRVLAELGKVAFANPADVLDINNGGVRDDAAAEDLACIAAVRVRIGDGGIERDVRMCDKVKALELCGRHLGMFVDRKEVSAGDGKKLDVNIKVVD
uniref:Terminase small subunit n=1 Tax=Myoviridae sp. ctWiL39 TaxID=2825120 RepID=A0A8S5PWE5_9CAUD|nr:MAG TPA: Terminase small subunit [Myoviridae sp. ctWiL39]